MCSRLLPRSALLVALAVVALGLLGARPVDRRTGEDGPAEWTAGEAAGPMIVAPATDRISTAARAGALAAVAAAAAGLVAGRRAWPSTAVPVTVAVARSEALRTLRRRGPPVGLAR
jgi:hypothetical protein